MSDDLTRSTVQDMICGKFHELPGFAAFEVRHPDDFALLSLFRFAWTGTGILDREMMPWDFESRVWVPAHLVEDAVREIIEWSFGSLDGFDLSRLSASYMDGPTKWNTKDDFYEPGSFDRLEQNIRFTWKYSGTPISKAKPRALRPVRKEMQAIVPIGIIASLAGRCRT